jgi:hypothetical protein
MKSGGAVAYRTTFTATKLPNGVCLAKPLEVGSTMHSILDSQGS